MKFKLYKVIIFVFILFAIGCEDILQEDVYSQLGPENFLQTETDAIALLNSVYAIRNVGSRDPWLMEELPTDLMIQRGGGLRGLAQPLEDFTWDPGFGFLNTAFNTSYNVISRANLVIDEVPNINMNEDRKRVIIAEARFLRAANYIYLYNFFGPVPLVTTSDVTPEDRPSRAAEDEIFEFVESEMLAASEDLPEIAAEFGRATWGAALALLSRFYINNKEWEKTADISKIIIDSGVYSLFEDEHRTELFAFGNENNTEFIYVHEYLPIDGYGNTLLAHIVPPSYQFEAPPKENFAAQYQTLSNFLNSFHPDDERKDAIITEYINNSGELVQLGEDNARSLKFPEDLSATGRSMGNNHPIIRYADILLHRAEALNELNGPNQESINLINKVREAAGVPLYSLNDFASTEAFRDSMLAERGWEFFTEGLRRQDLIRHGKFIEYALERGKSASDHHTRYPIPQQQMDRNPNLQQNPGY
jgi:starch-binding outer membrane protein, SusD/RagB family